MDASRFPEYHFPLILIVKILFSLIHLNPRSITDDANFAMQGITPPVHIIGYENIPDHGPALITMNHYARKGFFIIWAALAIAANLTDDQLWLMTSEWTKRTGGFDQIQTKLTHWLFKRISQIYGFITTPAMPPDPRDLPERVASIRNIFQRIEANPRTILCMAPEGRDFSPEDLGYPAPGTGKFIYELIQQLHTVIPVGVYESNGCLHLNFGPSYKKEDFKKTTDKYISQFVMERIARQMPDLTPKN